MHQLEGECWDIRILVVQILYHYFPFLEWWLRLIIVLDYRILSHVYPLYILCTWTNESINEKTTIHQFREVAFTNSLCVRLALKNSNKSGTIKWWFSYPSLGVSLPWILIVVLCPIGWLEKIIHWKCQEFKNNFFMS